MEAESKIRGQSQFIRHILKNTRGIIGAGFFVGDTVIEGPVFLEGIIHGHFMLNNLIVT